MIFLSSLTHKILRAIGSPFCQSNTNLETTDVSKLYLFATKNRMPLLYLDTLRQYAKLGHLEKEYNKLSERYTKTIETISRVNQVLDVADINYAIFKSVRPYREVTSDVDVLIYGIDYPSVITAMAEGGFKLLDAGPISATFRDNKVRINVDIYYEVGASRIIYLDKNKLQKFIVNVKLPNGEAVRSLDPSADLLAIIAHSIIKEQMYVLSEYYTSLYYLSDLSTKDLSSFLSLVDECRMNSAVKTHLGATALLHYGVHRFIPHCLRKLLNELGLNNLELSRIKELGAKIPHKYHPLTMTKVLIEMFGENKAKRSYALQVSSMLNPKFASFVLKQMVYRFSRETY